MADTTGYDNKWSQNADKGFEITVPLDVSTYDGFGLHLVYTDRPHDDPIDKYSLNTVTGYRKKLVIKSSSATESVITMYGQRATSALFEIGKKIDCLFFFQAADANYNVDNVPFGDPVAFCTATKGSKTALPDLDP